MLEAVGVSEEFIGVTFIAIVPNLAEYVNAIQFALNADLDLSLEVTVKLFLNLLADFRPRWRSSSLAANSHTSIRKRSHVV